MARGDVIGTTIASVAVAGVLDFQPAIGVEGLILEIVGAGSSFVTMRYFDGITESEQGRSGTNAAAAFMTPSKFPITNGIYARLKNTSTGAFNLCMRGVQTK
jgi:hypothetical protein